MDRAPGPEDPGQARIPRGQVAPGIWERIVWERIVAEAWHSQPRRPDVVFFGGSVVQNHGDAVIAGQKVPGQMPAELHFTLELGEVRARHKLVAMTSSITDHEEGIELGVVEAPCYFLATNGN